MVQGGWDVHDTCLRGDRVKGCFDLGDVSGAWNARSSAGAFSPSVGPAKITEQGLARIWRCAVGGQMVFWV